MRSPLTYYGGKARMSDMLLALIPPHRTYAEVFAGGASLFWAKPPSGSEYLNDKNGNIANLYQVMKTDFQALQVAIETTLHCEYTFQQACDIYHNPDQHSSVKRAWATFYAVNQAFAGEAGGSWKWARNKQDNWTPPVKTDNRRRQFHLYQRRLEKTTIFNRDAIDIIPLLDGPDTFFYCDPPYVDARQGHYSGYTQPQFDALLQALSNCKGKFLLSSYTNQALTEMVLANGWQQQHIDMRLGVTSGNTRKTEVLTYNYSPPKNTLFDD